MVGQDIWNQHDHKVCGASDAKCGNAFPRAVREESQATPNRASNAARSRFSDRWRCARDIRTCLRPGRVRTPPRDAGCRSVRCRRTSRPVAGRGRRARVSMPAAFNSRYSASAASVTAASFFGLIMHTATCHGAIAVGPEDAGVVVVLFDRRRNDARHADAVAAHRRHDGLAVGVEHRALHRLGVLAAELEHVADLDAAGDAERALAVGRRIAGDDVADVGDDRRVPAGRGPS